MADQAPTIFTDDQSKAAPVAPDTTVIDPNNPVALLVGEGRKYKTIEDLAKAYVNIDGFVEQLKSENSKLRQDLAQAKTLDDVLDQLKASNAPPPDKDESPVKALGVDEIAAIVKQTVTGMETARTKQDNLRKADAKMKELFGEKAAEVFSQEAPTQEKREALVALASVDPDKFVALFAKPPANKQVGMGTDVNTAALQHINVSGRAADPTTKEYYEALRKKEPAKYYSQHVQLAMQKAAISNPAHYFGRT